MAGITVKDVNPHGKQKSPRKEEKSVIVCRKAPMERKGEKEEAWMGRNNIKAHMHRTEGSSSGLQLLLLPSSTTTFSFDDNHLPTMLFLPSSSCCHCGWGLGGLCWV